ncbi:MAG: ABC transporter ATP-binding protein [Bacteroidales bacterium]|nr:ABC transporter ATP-binding protein [Bacteroidales bacterium]
MEEKEVIVVCNLSKYYELTTFKQSFFRSLVSRKEKFKALNDVSFKINRNEIVGITGPNGSGKTTLLKILAGIIPYDEGTIKIKGKITALLSSGLGFHKDLTGYDNILIYAKSLGIPTKVIRENIHKILEFSEIGKFLYEPIKRYSSGMLDRLSFSVVQFINSEIVLFDEVFSFSDVSFQNKINNYIKEFSKNKTIIIVTHKLNVLINLCDRVIVLYKGNKIADDIPLYALNTYYKHINLNLYDNFQYKCPEINFDPPFNFNGFKVFKCYIVECLSNGEEVRKQNSIFSNQFYLCIVSEILTTNAELSIGYIIMDSMNNRLTLFYLDTSTIKIKYNEKTTVKAKLNSKIFSNGLFKIQPFIVNLVSGKFIFLDSEIFFVINSEEKKLSDVVYFPFNLNVEWSV